MAERLLTRDEAAQRLGISPHTLAVWHSSKREPRPAVIKVGTRTIRYSESEIQRFIAQQTQDKLPSDLRG